MLMLGGADVVPPASEFDVLALVLDGVADAEVDVPDVVFDVPYAVFGADADAVFDVPYVLPVFDELLIRVLWLVDSAVFVLPCTRLIMSFQLAVEHPPSATSSAPATAVMRNFDVLI